MSDAPGLWMHQVEAIDHLTSRRASLLDMGMGTGKSRCIVEAWLREGRARHVVILCPKSVRAVWRTEFEKYTDGLERPEILIPDGSATWARRVAKLDQRRNVLDAMDQPLVVVFNYEALLSEVAMRWMGEFRPDLLVLDESHKLKAPNGKLSKRAAWVAQQSKRIVALTGTPMPHSPLDVFGQFRSLDPTLFGRSFYRFKTRYGVMGGYMNKQVVRFQRMPELTARMAPFVFHASRDVLDLPPAMHETISVELSPKARKLYDALDEGMIAYVEEEGDAIAPANALVKLLRLAQLTSGVAVTGEGGDTSSSLVDTSKREALADLIDGAGKEPLVVFGKFRADLDGARAVCEQLKVSFSELSGQENTLAAWQAGESQVLGVQMQSGGVGIDLTRARYCVYLSTGYNLGDYEQSLARVHRPGQDRPVTYYHVIAARTVDEKTQKALASRSNVVEAVLDMYRKALAA